MKFIEPIIFIVAFVVVTAVLIVLNSMFTNIFNFDFTSVTAKVQVTDSTKTNKPSVDSLLSANKNTSLQDSLKIAANNQPAKDSIKTDTTKIIPQLPQITKIKDNPIQTTQKEIPDTTNISPLVNTNYASANDSNYVKWLKATAAMYESMDPRKAARIIQNYSEKVARDIIYKMKKKKAADILAELDPSVALRIANYGG